MGLNDTNTTSNCCEFSHPMHWWGLRVFAVISFSGVLNFEERNKIWQFLLAQVPSTWAMCEQEQLLMKNLVETWSGSAKKSLGSRVCWHITFKQAGSRGASWGYSAPRKNDLF